MKRFFVELNLMIVVHCCVSTFCGALRKAFSMNLDASVTVSTRERLSVRGGRVHEKQFYLIPRTIEYSLSRIQNSNVVDAVCLL